jgi:DNA repair exonuclease SbcCD ATPase subunit
MDLLSSPEAVATAHLEEFRQRQQREVNEPSQAIRDSSQGISQRDNDINLLRDFNTQQSLLLNAAARFDAYRRAQIDKHQRELSELNRVDIPQEVERLMQVLEGLLENGGVVRGRLDAVAGNIALLRQRIYQLEDRPLPPPGVRDIQRILEGHVAQYKEDNRRLNDEINELIHQIATIQARINDIQLPQVEVLPLEAEAMMRDMRNEDAKEIIERTRRIYELERQLAFTKAENDGLLQKNTELRDQLNECEARCQERQAEMTRLQEEHQQLQEQHQRLDEDNNECLAENDMLWEENGHFHNQYEELQEVRRENQEIQENNDYYELENEELTRRVDLLERYIQTIEERAGIVDQEGDKLQEQSERLKREDEDQDERFYEDNERHWQENGGLRQENERYEQDNDRLQQENERLEQENDRLQQENEGLLQLNDRLEQESRERQEEIRQLQEQVVDSVQRRRRQPASAEPPRRSQRIRGK